MADETMKIIVGSRKRKRVRGSKEGKEEER